VHRSDFCSDRHQHAVKSDLAGVRRDKTLFAVPQEQRRRMSQPRSRFC